MPTFDPRPVTLTGETIRLEPLSLAHAPDLLQAAAEKSIWSFMPLSGFPDLAAVGGWVCGLLGGEAGGGEVSLVVGFGGGKVGGGVGRFIGICGGGIRVG